MAITYPLSLPTTKSPARITLSAMSAVSVSRSGWSYISQVQQFSGQLLGAEITLPVMERADAEQWIVWLLKLNGKEGTFLLGDSAGKTPRGSVLGSPQVNGASQTGQVLNTKGWTATKTGVLLAGDYIQIGSRVYKNLTDANSDGSGLATLDIWPRLRESPGDSAAITTTNCQGLFRLDSNSLTLFDVSAAMHYSVSFSAVEAL